MTTRVSCYALAFVCVVASFGCGRQAQRDTALCQAVHDGDAGLARDALEAGANPDALYPGDEYDETGGWPVLGVAIYQRDAEMVQVLMNVGASLEQWPGHDATALTMAAEMGDLEIFTMLLDGGADEHVMLGPERDVSLIHVAAEKGRGQIVRFLIERGHDAESEDNIGETPLMFASHALDASAFWVLLDAGANATRLDDLGTSALHYALFSCDLDRIHRLLELGVPLEARSGKSDGKTALIMAAEQCELAIPLLLDGGANVDARDDLGRTALLCATHSSSDDTTLETLLDRGSNVDAAGKDGFTPLAFAVRNALTSRVRLLLEHGANPHALIAPSGQSVLEYAIELAERPRETQRERRRKIVAILKTAGEGG